MRFPFLSPYLLLGLLLLALPATVRAQQDVVFQHDATTAELSGVVTGNAGSILLEQDRRYLDVVDPDFYKEVYAASAMIYELEDDSSYSFLCSGEVYREEKDRYLVLTSAHCSDNASSEMFVSLPGGPLLLPARIARRGEPNSDTDFMVLEIPSDHSIKPIPLGRSKDLYAGIPLVSVCSSLGLGRMLMFGHLSTSPANLINTGKKWLRGNSMLVQIPIQGGASGAAVIDTSQHAIIGVIVGIVGKEPEDSFSPFTIAIPIDRLSLIGKIKPPAK